MRWAVIETRRPATFSSASRWPFRSPAEIAHVPASLGSSAAVGGLVRGMAGGSLRGFWIVWAGGTTPGGTMDGCWSCPKAGAPARSAAAAVNMRSFMEVLLGGSYAERTRYKSGANEGRSEHVERVDVDLKFDPARRADDGQHVAQHAVELSR